MPITRIQPIPSGLRHAFITVGAEQGAFPLHMAPIGRGPYHTLAGSFHKFV